MIKPDLILLHAPHVYDFRKLVQLHGPVSDLVPATPAFEMYPLGFTSLEEYLEKAGFRVRIVNLAYLMLGSRRFDAEKYIHGLDAPLFGIDLHWLVHAHGAVEMARLVKKHHPGARVIFGGFTASYYWQELIKYPEADYVMRGDTTEEPMRQFLKAFKSRRLSAVPNLVWKDSRGLVHDNGLSYVPDRLDFVMDNHYGGLVDQVLRYRDIKGIIPFKGWLSHPITAVFSCRGCDRQCVFCGGSRSAMKRVTGRKETAFRTPEEIHRDIKNISRVSRGPIFILADIRQNGEARALDLLRLLQRRPVNNTLMFELYRPATARFIEDLSLAAPRFGLDISPHSHDPAVRKATGLDYTNAELEETINAALYHEAERVEVYFMIGLPRQTKESVLEDTAYCEYLLRKFDADRRLFLYQGPLSPFLDPGSLAFENPGRYGYRLLFRTLAEHREALTGPSWKYILNYETKWLSRKDIVDVSYEANARLTGVKAKYGQISRSRAEAQVKRLERARELEAQIDSILASDHPEDLELLRPEIEKLNSFADVHHRQLIDVPLGLFKLRYLNMLWQLIKGKGS
jgi:B12-binding domain/radical SAM domain protein